MSEHGAELRQRRGDKQPMRRDHDDDGTCESASDGDTLLQQLESVEHDLQADSDTHQLLPEAKRDVHIESAADGETALQICKQVAGPFFIAGLGMVAAGCVLDHVQHWAVFQRVSEIFILVPALLGLKGNLEMTLASRLSTMANMGKMDTVEEMWRVACANLALIQAQAAVVALLASLFAVVLAWLPKGQLSLDHVLLLCASSTVTASLASLVLGLIMVGVIVQSRRHGWNPDNVATPIAASLGDLVTLAVLSGFGTLFLRFKETDYGYINGCICLLIVLLLPLWCYLACADPTAKQVLYTGWTPVIMAMCISSGGGFILKFAVTTFKGIAVFQPVINGVGGNLVAVQASRISTALHQSNIGFGQLPVAGRRPADYCNPARAFCGDELDARAARVLLSLTIPGHIAFNVVIHAIAAGHTSIGVAFMSVYLMAAVAQVSLLLFTCQYMVHLMWTMHVDPDNSAIPYLTALGDLSGTALLAAAFTMLNAAGVPLE